MKVENWNGYDIRFVEVDGEWWAILKDVCSALKLRTDKVAYRLDADMLTRVPIEGEVDIPSKYNIKDDHPSKGVVKYNRVTKTIWMLAINEDGIYEALFASRRIEARQFRKWSRNVMKKLRQSVGLEGYQVMQMTDPDVQSQIDYILDSLYWDEEAGMLMISQTVAGGDVEQIPFDEYVDQ